jgi:predicted porin
VITCGYLPIKSFQFTVTQRLPTIKATRIEPRPEETGTQVLQSTALCDPCEVPFHISNALERLDHMKKTRIALATLAAIAAASAAAQSSVTLFGIVDTSLSHGSGSVSSKTYVANSAYNSSRLGFRGTEDLGGGMSSSFWLEAGVASDDGQGSATNQNNQASGAGAAVAGRQGLTFNRRATVSLAGTWGELRLGRDYVPQFWNLTLFDPFNANGVGGNQLVNGTNGLNVTSQPVGVRASNNIGYFLPAGLGGIYGQLNYYLGENNSGTPTSSDGRGVGFRLGYAGGPINVAVASGTTKYATGDFRQSNLAGQWDAGVAKFVAQISRDRLGAVHARGWLVGAIVPFGTDDVHATYARYRTDLAGTPESSKFAVSYVHNFSKRTAVYATYARLKNSGGATQALGGSVTSANGSSTGYDLGIRHSF